MDIQSLSCNNCGAPLEVSPNANYVTCSYCKARLAIKRNASTVYTEVLTQIGENTGQMAGDLRFMRLKQQLQLLDEHWQERDRQFRQQEESMQARVATANNGRRGARTYSIGFMFTGIMVVLGALSANSSGSDRAGGLLCGFFLVAIAALAIWSYASHSRKYRNLADEIREFDQKYGSAKQNYQAQRTDLSSKLDASLRDS